MKHIIRNLKWRYLLNTGTTYRVRLNSGTLAEYLWNGKRFVTPDRRRVRDHKTIKAVIMKKPLNRVSEFIELRLEEGSELVTSEGIQRAISGRYVPLTKEEQAEADRKTEIAEINRLARAAETPEDKQERLKLLRTMEKSFHEEALAEAEHSPGFNYEVNRENHEAFKREQEIKNV